MSSWVRYLWILIQPAVEEDESNKCIGCTLQSYKEADEGQGGNNGHLPKIGEDNGCGCGKAELEMKIGTPNVDVLLEV